MTEKPIGGVKILSGFDMTNVPKVAARIILGASHIEKVEIV